MSVFGQTFTSMKIEYISHSCFVIETDESKLIIDPWFNGPCYKNQWNLFPKPVDLSMLPEVTHIAVTHGHQDHLHPQSLKMLPANAQVYFPYLWTENAKKVFRRLGFKRVQELQSYKTVTIDPATKLTFVANSLDGIVVIEHGDKVLVNLNDALNAHHKSILKHFLSGIKKRWPRIDFMLCGLGGAGYFPNTVHYPGKDDRETGELREQFLVHQFCKIVEELKPKAVLPFTPGFALLSEKQQWINEVKFQRELLDEYYRKNFDESSQVQFINMYPGDRLTDDNFEKRSPYHRQLKNGSVSHLVKEMYADEIKAFNSPEIFEAPKLDSILSLLKKWMPKAASVYHRELLDHVKFSVELSDVDTEEHLFIEYVSGKFNISKQKEKHAGSILTIVTTSDAIEYSLADPWGGDILFVGYAAEVFVQQESALKNNLDIVCLRLLTRYPTASKYMLQRPLRGLRYMLSNPQLVQLIAKNKMVTRGNPNKLPFNERAHWINKSKCEICMACDIPLLTYELGEMMEQAQLTELTE
jgi:hypothetical protein